MVVVCVLGQFLHFLFCWFCAFINIDTRHTRAHTHTDKYNINSALTATGSCRRGGGGVSLCGVVVVGGVSIRQAKTGPESSSKAYAKDTRSHELTALLAWRGGVRGEEVRRDIGLLGVCVRGEWKE